MKKINVSQLKKMYQYALIAVIRREDKINRLNVFPVPDGDTGSNVLSTILGGWNAIKDSEFKTIAEISDAFSRGALLGARGNSGVISSQIYKGLAVGLKDSGKEIVPSELKDAFIVARDYAYKAVSDPVEGTILSVANEVSKEAPKYEFDDFQSLLEAAYVVAEHAVSNTPNQMKILKEAGVVDSGAYSLQRVFYGFKKAISNVEYDVESEMKRLSSAAQKGISKKAPPISTAGYCTEFIMTLREDVKLLKMDVEKEVKKFGNSVVVVIDDDILKVHVHTKNPGEVLTYGKQFGEFGKIKIDNMDIQVHEEHIIRTTKAKNGIIAVSNGRGYYAEYAEVGATNIIDGGQGQNPSTSDFLEEIGNCNSENIIILPNNSNIVLAAEQAIKEYKGDSNIKVIPTKSSGQGIIASYLFDDQEDDFDSLYNEMNDAFKNTRISQISKSVKDVKLNGVDIKKDDYLSVSGKEALFSNKDLHKVTVDTLNKFINEDFDIITMFYGKDISRPSVKKIVEYVKKLKGDVDISIKDGGQDVYYWEFVGEQ